MPSCTLIRAARYASIGGKMNPSQPALIRAAIERMPEGARIVAATDNDPDGRKLSGGAIEALVRDSGRYDLVFQAHWPEEEGGATGMIGYAQLAQ